MLLLLQCAAALSVAFVLCAGGEYRHLMSLLFMIAVPLSFTWVCQEIRRRVIHEIFKTIDPEATLEPPASSPGSATQTATAPRP